MNSPYTKQRMHSLKRPLSLADIPPMNGAPTNGTPKGDGNVASHPGNLALLPALATVATSHLAKEAPYDSVAAGEEARLAADIASHERQRDETLAERKRVADALPAKYLERDEETKRGILICKVMLPALAILAWFNAAVWVDMNLTQSFVRGLLLSSAIPLAPFVFKGFFLMGSERQRPWFALGMLLIFLGGYYALVTEFGKHFTKMENPNPVAVTGGYGDSAVQSEGGVEGGGDAFTVSLSWFYFGAVVVETLGSFFLLHWLLQLLLRRIDPVWREGSLLLEKLDHKLTELEQRLAQLVGAQAALRWRGKVHAECVNALSHFLK